MTARDGPQDRYKAVWLIFFILGLGTLLPWNFFMTAREYFISRLADPEETSHLWNQTIMAPSYLQSMFDNFMTLCAMVPLLIFTCLNSFIHQRIPQQIRISGSLVAIGLVFLITAIMVKVAMEPLPFFVFTMISIVFINSFGAILQSSLFGLAGLLPASYTAPIMSGQGLAGTFAALAMIFSIAIGAQQPESFIGYFTTACVAIVLAIFSYILLPRMDFFRYYSMKDKTEYHVYNAELETKRDLIKKDEPNGMEQNNSKIIPIHNPDEKPSVIAIFKKLWVMALSVCFVFTVTIGVFPSITAKVSTVLGEENRWGLYFIPVSCFLLFNVFDWTGRSLTALFTWPGKDSCLLPVLVVLRVIFIPLFMLCNVQPRGYLPVVFSHDAWYIVFMIFFSLSNGYLASLCMCFGPNRARDTASLRMGPTPLSPLGKCLSMKRRQLEPSWPSSCRWAWLWELPSPSCSEFSSSSGAQRVQGYRETAPHPPPRPWIPRRRGEMTPHACPCQITLPRQTLHPGTVPLLQGWPGSCHARLCDAFRPMCLLLSHALCVCV